MRAAFSALEQAILEFLDQPDYPAMILDLGDTDVIYPITVLKNLDRTRDEPIVLLFPFACDDVCTYVGAVVDLLEAQAQAVNEARAVEHLEPWPPLPLVCRDPRSPPEVRLAEAGQWLHASLQPEMGIVWALLPSTIGDRAGYRRLVDPLLALAGVPGWLEGQHFLIRDDHAAPFLVPELEATGASGVLILRIDLSPGRAADTLVQTVNDPNQPVPARMQALTEVAALDFAHGRYKEAEEKQALLFDYHTQQGNAAGQAMALAGAGDIALQTGSVAQAKARYQQALALTVPTGNLGLMLNLLLAAGGACLRLEHWAEAEGYLGFASRVASKTLNPYAKIDAMEQQGDAQHRLRRLVDAAATWRSAEQLAATFDYRERRLSLLERLTRLAEAEGRRRDAEALHGLRQSLARGACRTGAEGGP